MPAFRPIPAEQACSFSLSFGDVARGTSLLRDDVPDRLLNRVAVTAAVNACGKKSIAELDAMAHAAEAAASALTARRHPDDFWKRTAGGVPSLRLDGKFGSSEVNLARKLRCLGSNGQAAIERVRSWPLWALIHPDAIDTDGLLWLEELVGDDATTREWFNATDRSVSTALQIDGIVNLTKQGQVDLALNALWLSLRRSSIEADLPRYAHLYHAWLVIRPLLEAHPLFRAVVPLLYEFTAYWFGQVEVITDRFLRPFRDHEHRYKEFVQATFDALRSGPDHDAQSAWDGFRIGNSAFPPGMEVTPNLEFLTELGDAEEQRTSPAREFWQNWPLIQRITLGSQLSRARRPGLTHRPNAWGISYGVCHPMPPGFDRLVNAATISKEIEGLEEKDLCLFEWKAKLFALRGSGEPEYPWFQSFPEVRGKPLAQVLDVLGSPKMSGELVWKFFMTKSDFLANLSPLELLLADPSRTRLRERLARQFLAATEVIRLAAVLKAAEEYRIRLERESDRASGREVAKSAERSTNSDSS